MIKISEIQPGELIKVLVNLEDDIEDEIYAKVNEVHNDYLVVSYYSETSFLRRLWNRIRYGTPMSINS